MAFRTEFSLEELLAEPMVVTLMTRDGVSIGEARALYACIGRQLKDGAKRASQRVANSPGLVPWTEPSPGQNSPCM
jgi:hypothetical protein